jgi:protein O-GlcNAcase / histone acetyltransferase
VPTVTQSEYLNTLGEKLINDICILWTGKHVISKIITQSEVEEITEVLKRKPVIWDNLHANDYDVSLLCLDFFCILLKTDFNFRPDVFS